MQYEDATSPDADGSSRGSDRILTLPNAITGVRLALLPVFWWLLFSQEDRAGAALLLFTLGATDFLDGYVARRFHQISNLGKVLDPVADRVLFFVGVTGIWIDGSVAGWFAAAVLVREVLVAVATITLAALGAKRIDVTWFGKAGTFCLMVAFPLFLAGASSIRWAAPATTAAWLIGLPGLGLSWFATALYVPLARQALREGRSGPPASPVSSPS
jgi:cardiolipin synthase